MTTQTEARPRRALRRLAIPHVPATVRYAIVVYGLSRVLYLIVAILDGHLQHWSLQYEMSNWDGFWYLRTTEFGYPHVIPSVAGAYSTLGFLPLYPMMMWVLWQVPGFSAFGAGLTIALASGLVATVQMSRLAERWWGEMASRRAILCFCLLPGSVVFSMDYAEGVQLALVATMLLALEDRRWLMAGITAGLATAVSPLAVAVIPTCAVAALVELRRRGLRDPQARRSLLAPLLSPLGLVGFGLFLWTWTGSPFASYIAQSHAWQNSTTPLAIPRLVGHLAGELLGKTSYGYLGPSGIDLNDVNGLLGTIVVLVGLWLLWRRRDRVHVTAITWTLAVLALTATSDKTPPNARMTLCAFPAVMAIGAACRGRRRLLLLGTETVLLVVMTWFTYVGTWLRP